ncbi:hypothetical protein B0H13DRAFT_2665953 [Mycena leptocephala]|nr:hypothetical protein B0H13DRAFT_2665953 [Mycena leptocephala]
MGDPPTEWLPTATLQAVLLGLMHSQPSEPRRSWIDCGLSVIGAMQNASPAGVDVDVGAGVGEGQMKIRNRAGGNARKLNKAFENVLSMTRHRR